MKRIVTFILALCMLSLTLVSCSGEIAGKIDADVDLNFTGISDSQMYDTISYFMANPKDYSGKSIAITALSSVSYCFSTNKINSHGIIALDPTNCCDAYYEIKTKDGKYPDIGTKATFIGAFTDSYIDVSETRNAASVSGYDVDTFTMSSVELYDFMTAYGKDYLTDGNNGKSIRVCGHLSEDDGYNYIIGLDAKGKATWYLEVTNPNGLTLPKQNGNYLNPVEISGVLKYYQEGERLYPCIEIRSLCKIVATLG